MISYKIDYGTVFWLLLFHCLAFVGLFCFKREFVFIAFVYWFLAGCFGVAIGFHRLLTHKSFKTFWPITYFFSLCGCLALQSGPINWIAWHREHHKFTDKENDPHSPTRGFLWSHVGWMIYKNPRLYQQKFLEDMTPDLQKDKFYLIMNRLWWAPTLVVALGVFYFFGLSGVLCGVIVPVVFGWHATWLVNSACHMWGNKVSNTDENSRNLWWVALITFGEGWHDNHHSKQISFRHGFRWYQIDISAYVIIFLRLFGLAKGLRS